MKRNTNAVVLMLLAGLLAGTAGCSRTELSWVTEGRFGKARDPATVRTFFTYDNIPEQFMVVARFTATTSAGDYADAMRAIRSQAAQFGCDAIVYERASQRWTFLTFLVAPIWIREAKLTFLGISYLRRK